MTLRRGAVLCWRLVQTVALIAYCGCGMLRGRPGRPVDLVTGNFGDYGGLMDLNIRAIGRSDFTTVWDFCKADRGDQLTWFMRGNFETFKNFEIF